MTLSLRNLELLKQFVREQNPNITVRKGAPLHDLHLTPLSALLEQYETDLEDAFGEGGGLSDFDSVEEERYDALSSNQLVERLGGAQGLQTARIIIDELGDYNFGEGELVATDGDGNTWYNEAFIGVTEAQLNNNREGSFFYVDATFISEEEGSDLSLISSLEDTSQFGGYVSIAGIEGTLVDGVTRETNQEMWTRMLDGISANSLVINKGAKRLLFENFGQSLREVITVGMGDDEMMRDIPRSPDGRALEFPLTGGTPLVNLHLGGHTDIYVKTQKASRQEADFFNLSIDETKELTRTVPVKLNAATNVFIGRNPLVSVDSITTLAGAPLALADFNIDLNLGVINSATGSSDTVKVTYKYNPITVDIKAVPSVEREDFTIEQLVFLRVVSIAELDPVSGTPTSVIYDRNGGFGQGPFGAGPFGRGQEGDYSFYVLTPHERFSMEEESFIEFASKHIGKDIRVTYDCVPEISPIHDFVRSREYRTEAGDSLIKNFLPIFVGGVFDVETSDDANAPDEATLLAIIEEVIHSKSDEGALDLDDIIAALFQNGVSGIIKCFELTGELHHTNGGIQILKSKEVLTAPSPTLLRDTNKVVSPVITRFYPGDIVVNVTQV